MTFLFEIKNTCRSQMKSGMFQKYLYILKELQSVKRYLNLQDLEVFDEISIKNVPYFSSLTDCLLINTKSAANIQFMISKISF